ncbi:MAG TPA: ATP-binding protein [Longimicrobiales bacterium]|nr:ATP-binding protein [Longimicrobiales bacterium]
MPSLSFRSRILLTVLVVSVVPLALVGLWLTGTAQRSGQELLRVRLEEALDQAVTRIGTNWLRQRSDLLFLAEERTVQRVLRERLGIGDPAAGGDGGVSGGVAAPPARLDTLFRELDAAVLRVRVEDLEGNELWTLRRPEPPPGATLRQILPVHSRFPSEDLGRLVVDLEFAGLLSGGAMSTPLAGLVLGAVAPGGTTPLLPVPFDPSLMAEERFSWGRDDWLTRRRSVTEPAVTLVAAAPLSPFAAPFEEAARQGLWWIGLVASAGLLVTYVLTRRMTASLEELASTAEAVSRGELEVRIDDAGEDEVGRVAQAFNAMTASLRLTLRELANRERLAAVGEFAATLAHEVRNPLTAIRIDLQRVEESLPPDSPLREAQARALREIGRLDATVSETLEVARTGSWRPGGVSLGPVLAAAAAAAEPAFAERSAILESGPWTDSELSVEGDERALEQLFLNLLLNAAQALDGGGRAWIEVKEGETELAVAVHDSGRGIDPADRDRIFDPLYTTRADGTGLGLTVVRRIVDEHEGRIELESDVGRGTTVRVHLPR